MMYTISAVVNDSSYPIVLTPAGNYILADPDFPGSPLYLVGIVPAIDAAQALLRGHGGDEVHFVVHPVGD